jgi:transcriptional regulator with XRE-family HTH domain
MAADPKPGTRLAVAIGAAIRDSRIESGWSQRELAARLDVPQSSVVRLEAGRRRYADLDLASAAFGVLGIRLSFDRASLGLATRREQRDLLHAACCAYVSRRLRTDGWLTSSEVEIGSGRSRGWIDILAVREAERAVVVVEVKTEIHDLGAIQRTMAWYERAAWSAARARGLRPLTVSRVLLLLDSVENDARIRSNAGPLSAMFPMRGSAVRDWLLAPGDHPAGGLALIDPRSRRRAWLRNTRAEGRRSPAAYADYRDAAEAIGSIGSRRR